MQRKNTSPSKYLEQREYNVMWDLGDYYRALAKDTRTRESFGVIGILKERRGKDFIVRRPSAIYWNGLNTYQFINTQGLAADSFLKQAVNPSLESLLSSAQQGDDTTGDDADAEYENVFQIKVPPKSNWKENLTLDLFKEEAEFFRDRIISIAKNKLIAELLQNDKLWKVFSQADNFMQFAKAAISLPLADNLRAMLILSHDFSELMYGAHLAYNCLLQNRVFNSNYFDEDWNDWLDGIQDNMLDYRNFNPDVLFSYAASVRGATAQFVKDWWKQTQNNFPDIKKRDALIEQQEGMVKGGKARLRWNKTDNVRENSWVGLKYLEYRFFQARTILKDIRTGITS